MNSNSTKGLTATAEKLLFEGTQNPDFERIQYELKISNSSSDDEQVVAIAACRSDNIHKQVRIGDGFGNFSFWVQPDETQVIRIPGYALADNDHELTFYLKTKQGAVVQSTKPIKKTFNTKNIIIGSVLLGLLLIIFLWSNHANSQHKPWWTGETNVYTVSQTPVQGIPPEVMEMSSSQMQAVSNGSQITEVILAGVPQKTQDTICTVSNGIHECSFAFTGEPLGDIWTVASAPGLSQ